jgi:hypothetical protein
MSIVMRLRMVVLGSAVVGVLIAPGVAASTEPLRVGPDPDTRINQTIAVIWINEYAMDRGRALLREGYMKAAAKYVRCIVDEGTRVEGFGSVGRNAFRVMVLQGHHAGCDGVASATYREVKR